MDDLTFHFFKHGMYRLALTSHRGSVPGPLVQTEAHGSWNPLVEDIRGALVPGEAVEPPRTSEMEIFRHTQEVR